MPLLHNAVEQFLAGLRSRRAPTNTIKSYAHDLRHFVQAVPADLDEATALAIQAFLAGDGHHILPTLAPRNATLCSFYRWPTRQVLVETDLMTRRTPGCQPYSAQRPSTPHEARKIHT